MNELTILKKKELVNQMPKKYSEYRSLKSYDGDLFRKEQLIEIVIGDKSYMGQCFINETHKEMYWRPQHRWYVEIKELDASFSYDLLQYKLVKIVPTEVQLNTFYETKLKKIMKKGKFHLNKTQEAYVELQDLRGMKDE